MTIEIFSESKGNIIYKNIKTISTGAIYADGRPVFQLRLSQLNHSVDINIDDITGFEIHDSPKTWIEDTTDIICPYCGQTYSDEIFWMAHGDKIMDYCPKCGNRVDREEQP